MANLAGLPLWLPILTSRGLSRISAHLKAHSEPLAVQSFRPGSAVLDTYFLEGQVCLCHLSTNKMTGMKNARGTWNERTALFQMSQCNSHGAFRNLGGETSSPLWNWNTQGFFSAYVSGFRWELKDSPGLIVSGSERAWRSLVPAPMWEFPLYFVFQLWDVHILKFLLHLWNLFLNFRQALGTFISFPVFSSLSPQPSQISLPVTETKSPRVPGDHRAWFSPTNIFNKRR